MMDTILKRITELHSPELIKTESLVVQLWDDGEVTLQKAKDLMWLRTLHQIRGPLCGVKIKMPCDWKRGISYAVIPSIEEAIEIRELMAKNKNHI